MTIKDWYFLLSALFFSCLLTVGFGMLIWYAKKTVEEISKLTEVIRKHASDLVEISAKKIVASEKLNETILSESKINVPVVATESVDASANQFTMAIENIPTPVDNSPSKHTPETVKNDTPPQIQHNLTERNDDAEFLLIKLFNENKWDNFLLKAKENGFPIYLAVLSEVGMVPVLHKWTKSRFSHEAIDIFIGDNGDKRLYLLSRRSPVHSESICEAYNTVNIEGNHYYKKLAVYNLDKDGVHYSLVREGELLHR